MASLLAIVESLLLDSSGVLLILYDIPRPLVREYLLLKQQQQNNFDRIFFNSRLFKIKSSLAQSLADFAIMLLRMIVFWWFSSVRKVYVKQHLPLWLREVGNKAYGFKQS